jgi:hypothetical protein
MWTCRIIENFQDSWSGTIIDVRDSEGIFEGAIAEMSHWTWYSENRSSYQPHGSRNISQWRVEQFELLNLV